MEEKIFIYVRAMWYESKCKNPDDIYKIIVEELVDYDDGDYDRLCRKILRRCKNELN